MTAKLFRISCVASVDKIGTITGLLAGEANNLTVEEFDGKMVAMPRRSGVDSRQKIHRRVIGPRKKADTTCASVVMSCFSPGRDVVNMADIEKALTEANFAPTSASPTLTVLEREGKVARMLGGSVKIKR